MVFTLRCTKSLLTRLGQPVQEPPEPTTILGDWYANTLNVGRQRLVLCTSERTLLTILVPARELIRLPDRLRDAVARMLSRLSVPSSLIDREMFEMRSNELGRTASRQILGSMNDLGYLAETYIRYAEPNTDLDDIAAHVNRSPCRPISYQSPDRATQAIFQGGS